MLTFAAPTLTMLMCTLVAWYVVRSQMRGKRLLDVMAFLPEHHPEHHDRASRWCTCS